MGIGRRERLLLYLGVLLGVLLRGVRMNYFELGDVKNDFGFQIVQKVAESYSGYSVTGVGDINGDSIDDIAIGTGGGQKVYILFGTKNPPSSSFNLEKIDGTNGFQIISQQTHFLGYSISGGGDFNGDGKSDLLIGAPDLSSQNGENCGGVFVIYGRERDNPFPNVIDLIFQNETLFVGVGSNEYAGLSVSFAGDVNGDHFDDIMIGSADGIGYVVYGSSNPTTDLSALKGPNGFAVQQKEGKIIVSNAGDVNGDGYQDLLFGVPEFLPITERENDWMGEVYLIFGASDSPINGTDPLVLSEIPEGRGSVLKGKKEGGRLGSSLSSAGDFNHDGVDDFLIGSSLPLEDNYLLSRGYVIFGGKELGWFNTTIELSDLGPLDGFHFDAEEPNGESYWRENVTETPFLDPPFSVVARIGDYNHDGISDVALGTPYADIEMGDGWTESVGRVYVIFGAEKKFPPKLDLQNLDSSTGFVLEGTMSGAIAGAAIRFAGDFNCDGRDDFLVGSPSVGDANQGAAFVLFGSGVQKEHTKHLIRDNIFYMGIGLVLMFSIVLGVALYSRSKDKLGNAAWRVDSSEWHFEDDSDKLEDDEMFADCQSDHVMAFESETDNDGFDY